MKPLVVAALVVCALALGLASRPAAGQQRVTDALALARVCVSEASLPGRAGEAWVRRDGSEWGADCWAIHEVLLRGAERHGMRYVAFARAYSGSVFAGSRWVADLWPAAHEPAGWPRYQRAPQGDRVALLPHPPWSRYRAAWLAALELAGRIVAHGLEEREAWSPCAEPVDDWGGEMDRARAARLGLVPVRCEGTANDFYRRPQR